jgi:hypothetical protein
MTASSPRAVKAVKAVIFYLPFNLMAAIITFTNGARARTRARGKIMQIYFHGLHGLHGPRATTAGLHSAHFGGSDTHLRRCHRPAVVVHRMSLAAEIAGRAT